tara:strand:- start:9291 stop:10310 length:1020 start_codon:yes stop_codon:yes gene_type:complete
MSTNQFRLNPSKAISSFKGRYDMQRAHPSKSVSEFGPNGLVTGPAYATRASGGTEHDQTTYKAYSFQASGSFVTDKGGLADILLVGGGGAGAAYSGSKQPGGGGAGGFRLIEEVTLDAGTTYTVTVGAAGTPGSGSTGGQGGFSRINGGSIDYHSGGGGGGAGNGNGDVSNRYNDGDGGAGGGAAILGLWTGSGVSTYSGGSAGEYGGAGANSSQSGNWATAGHGGGKVDVSPSTGTSAYSPGTVRGSYNEWKEGSNLSYASGGAASRTDGSGSWDTGYSQTDWDVNGTASGRIAGGRGGSGAVDNKSANQNTGGGGGGVYGGTSGSGSAGEVIVRVFV